MVDPPAAEPEATWVTAVAEVEDDDVLVRGYRLSELIGSVTFTEAAFLVLAGELPSPAQRQMFDALLVSVVEHGISPSSQIVRMLTSCGTPVQAAIAGGVLSVADYHGGAGLQLAGLLASSVDEAGGDRTRLADIVARHAGEHRSSGRRIEGFGHPQHPGGDPRARLLLDLATELGVAGWHCDALAELASAVNASSTKRALHPNVNGAFAAIILDLGLPVEATRGAIITARTIGLLAHAVEDARMDVRWRHASSDDVAYTGPGYRALPERPVEA